MGLLEERFEYVTDGIVAREPTCLLWRNYDTMRAERQSSMKIVVSQIQPRDELNKVFVNVSFSDEEGPPYNSCDVNVFVEHTDSYTEIRKRAIDAAQRFLGKALAAPPIETPAV
jgi:hypothetical protein